ncbi:MAG TPA: hypothetical protein GX717_02915 [Clostridiaceae bacterium]|nr:hypothetical protein [Clostridiaceae bacterium]
MILRLQRLYIAMHTGRLLFFVPIIILYVLMPVACISTFHSANLNESRSMFIYILHSLVPVLSLLWMLAHLQIWIDSEGSEALYANRQRGKGNVPDLLVLLGAYLAMTLPGFAIASHYYRGIWLEWLRFASVVTLLTSAFYVLSITMRSVAMASLITFTYSFISVLYTREASLSHILLLKPHRELIPGELTENYLPFFLIGCFLFFLGHLLETRLYRAT